MTLIQPETVPTKGVGKYFNLVALNFPMNPNSVSFYWQLFTEAENEDHAYEIADELDLDYDYKQGDISDFYIHDIEEVKLTTGEKEVA